MNHLTQISCTAFAEALAAKAAVPGGVRSVTTAVLARYVIEAAEKTVMESAYPPQDSIIFALFHKYDNKSHLSFLLFPEERSVGFLF